MNIEQRVNAIMRYIVAETREEKNLAISEIKNIMEYPAETENNKNIEEMIDSIFMEIGMPCHLIGYNYTVYAIKIAIENPDIINNITFVLYPTVASKYDTTSSRVERGISRAIESAWNRADIDVTPSTHGASDFAEWQVLKPVSMRKISKRHCTKSNRSGLMCLCRTAYTDADALSRTAASGLTTWLQSV